MKESNTAKLKTAYAAATEPVCAIPLEDIQVKELAEIICKQAKEEKLTMRNIMDAFEIVRNKFEEDAVI